MAERTVTQCITPGHVVSLGPHASIWEAASLMTKAHCGSVLVLDGPETLLGIVTERDLMTRVLAKSLNPDTTLVSEIMTRSPHCVAPDMLVSDAVLIMIERGFRHLPVVTAAGKIVGVFSARNALPREIGNAVSLAEFHDQVNDALG